MKNTKNFVHLLGLCRLRMVILTLLVANAGAAIANSATDRDAPSAGVCEVAAQQASRETGVPIDVLRAISLTETGRRSNGRLTTWPWTVNMEGKGLWFATRHAAVDYAVEQYKRGARSFDTGCFQINYKWHHKAFSSIDAMFDPQTNALYAAQFLKSLFAETGDWSRAAGAFHSRTPEYAEKYRARFARHLANLGEPSNQGLDLTVADRVTPTRTKREEHPNTFPLLLAGGAPHGLGSLVPIDESGASRLIRLD